jgi:hypothetical protein
MVCGYAGNIQMLVSGFKSGKAVTTDWLMQNKTVSTG